MFTVGRWFELTCYFVLFSFMISNSIPSRNFRKNVFQFNSFFFLLYPGRWLWNVLGSFPWVQSVFLFFRFCSHIEINFLNNMINLTVEKRKNRTKDRKKIQRERKYVVVVWIKRATDTHTHTHCNLFCARNAIFFTLKRKTVSCFLNMCVYFKFCVQTYSRLIYSQS